MSPDPSIRQVEADLAALKAAAGRAGAALGYVFYCCDQFEAEFARCGHAAAARPAHRGPHRVRLVMQTVVLALVLMLV